MAKLPLTNGGFALVDKADLQKCLQYKWHRTTLGYIFSSKARLRLHRFIMGKAPEGALVDHKNGQPADNRRRNLRWCDITQNNVNRFKQPGTASQFKGVTQLKGETIWRAQIGRNGVNHYLGCFFFEEDAARAYDAKAKEFWGEYARLNFDGEGKVTCHNPHGRPPRSTFFKHKGRSSKFRGVHFHRLTGLWMANLTHKKTHYDLGTFEQEADAALAYDLKARELQVALSRFNDSGRVRLYDQGKIILTKLDRKSEDRACKFCGTPFKTFHNDHVFCDSKQCKSERGKVTYYQTTQCWRRGEERHCQFCDSPFKAQSKNQTCCDREQCREAARKIYMQAYDLRRGSGWRREKERSQTSIGWHRGEKRMCFYCKKPYKSYVQKQKHCTAGPCKRAHIAAYACKRRQAKKAGGGSSS